MPSDASISSISWEPLRCRFGEQVALLADLCLRACFRMQRWLGESPALHCTELDRVHTNSGGINADQHRFEQLDGESQK